VKGAERGGVAVIDLETFRASVLPAGPEVDQLQRPLRHLEDHFAAVSLGVAADLERISDRT